MKRLNISDVRKSLPSLLDAIEASREGVIITRHGRPVARILPYQEAGQYPLRDLPIRIADDFDAPSDELWEALEQ